MSIRARQVLIFLLVGAFAAQSWLVYSDPAGRQHALSPLAAEGLEAWRDHNCQSCHQLFGFGGFLGPDLTNAIGALSPERLESILTEGAGQMPAFGLSAEQRTALAAFLTEMDATGVSQPKLGESVPPADLMRQLSEVEAPPSPAWERGRDIVLAQNCIACHLPYEESLHRASDLTTVVETVAHDDALAILRDGVPGKAMPRLGLSTADGEAVLEFLDWMHEQGPEIRARFAGLATSSELDLSRVPWFEF